MLTQDYDLWAHADDAAAINAALAPSIDDLILTTRFAPRPRDAEDIRLLRQLKEQLG